MAEELRAPKAYTQPRRKTGRGSGSWRVQVDLAADHAARVARESVGGCVGAEEVGAQGVRRTAPGAIRPASRARGRAARGATRTVSARKELGRRPPIGEMWCSTTTGGTSPRRTGMPAQRCSLAEPPRRRRALPPEPERSGFGGRRRGNTAAPGRWRGRRRGGAAGAALDGRADVEDRRRRRRGDGATRAAAAREGAASPAGRRARRIRTSCRDAGRARSETSTDLNARNGSRG